MSAELVILAAAFLFFMGWFFDAVRQEEYLLTTTYVSLVERKWQRLPQLIIDCSMWTLTRTLGDIWSIRNFVIIVIYSITCNILVIFVFSKDVDLWGPIINTTFITILAFGAVHDCISMTITRIIISMKFKYLLKIFIDLFVAVILFSSNVSSLLMSAVFASYYNRDLLAVDNYMSLIDIWFSNTYYYIKLILPFIKGADTFVSVYSNGDLGVNIDAFRYAAITTLFPTFCYVSFLFISMILTALLYVFHRPISSFLDWLSRLPSHRIGLSSSGISALIVLLQAWIAYFG